MWIRHRYLNLGATMASQLYLVHHGIKGQRWGVRRFQNKDGGRAFFNSAMVQLKGIQNG